MRYPTFVAEMGLPSNRGKLWFGVRSGYAVAACFGLLAWVGGETGVVPHRSGFYALLAAKALTNTLALLALRRDVAVLETQGLNTVADVVLLTGAVHLTGGALSPLFATYVILISVVALLSNRGVTTLIAALAFVSHATALVLGHLGVVAVYPPPASPVSQPFTAAQLALAIAFAGFVLGVTTFFTSGLLARLKRKTRQLEQRTEELLEAGQQKSHFMANVTHELRTPIHGICGLTDLLDAEIYGPLTEEQRDAHRSIRESAGGLLRLIDDLLTMAKAEAGALRLRPADVPLPELVESVVASVRWMIGTKELHLDVEAELGLPPLKTDRGKLSQVLVNLLSNAVKFTPEGGTVTLRVRAEERDGVPGVAFDVVDTGIGIPPAQLERVFRPFRQVDGSDEREFGGVGLGLSLVKRLVEMLEGEIELASRVGKGTTFSVWLPPAIEAPAVPSEPPARDEVSGARRIA
ncbi:MAG TPA: HAMP domain-containing sensor histidine kinase [Polyangiaceae bacterium LLY-WYZ-15_(1-7)]|nr:hypothetical protein [Myxococcales bacterium]MAT28424.1 hypothetical protein [Sandaracinus sp.]HJK91235.1 HAMP domain-containing sensor histidine kinase [Polyangiaceae bacterium LLY-WYZ-15_(1-7)]MBJ70391.1 hypothetical protein [Sandaracinus sp.]HJL03833.1 HAMP domain-containing sensor histidine kinase [Polyangiaceae bacterium LLY-WYZ-15_(1-7)]